MYAAKSVKRCNSKLSRVLDEKGVVGIYSEDVDVVCIIVAEGGDNC